jgi:Tfp pilus assembly protein PilV
MRLPSTYRRRNRRGFSLFEVVLGIAFASLVIGAGFAALLGAISKQSAPNAANDGLQTAQNFATEIEALAAYNPSLLSQMSVGQQFQVPASHALTPKTGGGTPVTVTVTKITQPPADGYTRSLGTVSITFTVDGKAQTANVPIAAIAPSPEQSCNPAAGVATGCIVGVGG